jgi:hypothetical protein
MKRNLSLVATLTLCLGFALSSGTRAGKPSTPPVTSTILDLRPDNTPYRIHSDSPLSRTNSYRNGVDSVISQLQSTPEWELSALSSSTRKMFIDFGDPVPGSSTSSAPFSSQYVAGRFITKCYLLYNPGGGPGDYIAVGNMTGLNSARPCPMLFRFDWNGITYRVWMNPAQYYGTDNALVTCTGVIDPLNPSSSKCNKWTIGPTGTNGGVDSSAQVRNLTQLTKLTTARGATTEETIGYYHMTFNIGLTNP